MSSKLRFAGVTFSVPMSWIGTALQGNAKRQFNALKNKIDVYNVYEISSENILNILDLIERTKEGGYSRSVPVLNEIVYYLRVLLLSNETEMVFHTLVLLDCIIKNSGFILHVMVGRRKFMKTMSWVARKHSAESSQANKRVAELALDCLQAWGEAFYPREEFYPHIYRTYMKLRYKYQMRFPRPDFDPTRVPIFLGEISYTEKTMANTFNNDLELNYSNLEETKEEPRGAHFTPQQTRPPIKALRPPPRRYVSPPESKSSEAKQPQGRLHQPDLIEFGAQNNFSVAPRRQQFENLCFGEQIQPRGNYYDLPASESASSFSGHGHSFFADPAFRSLYAPPPPPAPGPAPPTVPPGVPQAGSYTHSSSQSSDNFSPVAPFSATRALTPWDLSCTSGSPSGRQLSGFSPLAAQQPSRTNSIGNTNSNVYWDIDGALDLVRLAESLPSSKEKEKDREKEMEQKQWQEQVHEKYNEKDLRNPPLPLVPPAAPSPVSPLSSVATVPNNVVAQALAEFKLTMREANRPACAEEQTDQPPPLSSPMAPTLVPQAVSATADLPEPPKVPPPPPPIVIVETASPTTSTGISSGMPSGVSIGELSEISNAPDWLELPARTVTPPPVPATPPPSLAISPDVTAEAQQQSPAHSTSISTSTSSEEDPIWTVIQNMNNPYTLVHPAPKHTPFSSASKSIPPPPPGPPRPKRSPQKQPDPEVMSYVEIIKQHRSHLSHIDDAALSAARASAPATSSSSSFFGQSKNNPFEEVVLTRFDPTAGPRPAVPTRKAEPRKVGFAPPSSDPNNEIKYYGNQRVVSRKAT